MTYRVSSAHEEAGERVYSVSTSEFLGDHDGNVASLRMSEVVRGGQAVPVEGTEQEIPAELVLLAMGFTGPSGTRSSLSWACRSTHGATWRETTTTPPTSMASSSAATPAGASR